jgi:glycosyltransferase involved in cell wall biosynthesis
MSDVDAPSADAGWFGRTRPEVAVIVPCYNEERRIDPDAFTSLFRDETTSAVFVDDGSTDDTMTLLRTIQQKAPERVEIIHEPQNRGKAHAVSTGLRAASSAGASWVGYLDADLAVPVEEWTRLVAMRSDAVDGVLASRVRLLGRSIDRSPVRHLAGRGFATLASLLLAIPVYDTQCGAKLFRVTSPLDAALATPFKTTWLFDVELLARLLYPSDRTPGVAPTRFVEAPLHRWTDVPGGALSAASIPVIATELLALIRDVRARRRTRH